MVRPDVIRMIVIGHATTEHPMSSSRMKTLTAVTLATLAIAGSASDAFAIRNRYTNEQAQGFGAYFFGDYGRPYGYGDDGYGYDEGPVYGDDRPIRRHRWRRPVYGYDE